MSNNETRSDRFRRLASKRVQAALDKIRIVGNLANPANEYSQEDAAKIIAAIDGAAAEMRDRLNKVKPERQPFTLD
jgi:ribosome-associated translation inhibitor RaiA